jgi:hypothetical protein
MFDSVIVVAFQIAFRAEIYVNDVFSFFKNYFWHQHIKTIQKVQTTFNFSKKIIIEIWSNTGSTAELNRQARMKLAASYPKLFLKLEGLLKIKDKKGLIN